MDAIATRDELAEGTVFTFTRDLREIPFGGNPCWTHRAPGVHMIMRGWSSSGWCAIVLNTATGKEDGILLEDWMFRRDCIRIVGTIEASTAA